MAGYDPRVSESKLPITQEYTPDPIAMRVHPHSGNRSNCKNEAKNSASFSEPMATHSYEAVPRQGVLSMGHYNAYIHDIPVCVQSVIKK